MQSFFQSDSLWGVVNIAIKTIVNIEKTRAWTNPTIISNIKNGKGSMKAKIEDTVKITTSPAKIFPNNLKDKDIIFVISDMISRTPIKRLRGLSEK